MRLEHAYEERDVELSLWIVDAFSGTPRPLEGQPLKWVAPARLAEHDILAADRPFIAALQRPASAALSARAGVYNQRWQCKA